MTNETEITIQEAAAQTTKLSALVTPAAPAA